MTGTIVKNHTTVIMDGSNREVVNDILNAMDVFVGCEHVECKPLDSKHPTMMVVETTADEFTYGIAQNVIENLYPGLCVFNPPM